MILYPLTGDLEIGTKAFKLWAIRKRPVAINGIKFFKSVVDERAVLFREAHFVLVAHGGSGHAARIMVATMQSSLVHQRCFLEKSRFFLQNCHFCPASGEVQGSVTPKDASANNHKIKVFYSHFERKSWKF